MTVHVYFFDTQGRCTAVNVPSLHTIAAGGGFWLNKPYELGSVYIDTQHQAMRWCIVAYRSVYHAGPANMSIRHFYPLLDALCKTTIEEKMIHLTNYKDVLPFYQTYDGLLQIESLLLPTQQNRVTVV